MSLAVDQRPVRCDITDIQRRRRLLTQYLQAVSLRLLDREDRLVQSDVDLKVPKRENRGDVVAARGAVVPLVPAWEMVLRREVPSHVRAWCFVLHIDHITRFAVDGLDPHIVGSRLGTLLGKGIGRDQFFDEQSLCRTGEDP